MLLQKKTEVLCQVIEAQQFLKRLSEQIHKYDDPDYLLPPQMIAIFKQHKIDCSNLAELLTKIYGLIQNQEISFKQLESIRPELKLLISICNESSEKIINHQNETKELKKEYDELISQLPKPPTITLDKKINRPK